MKPETFQNQQPTSRYGAGARYTAYPAEEERRLYLAGEYWTLILNCGPWIWKICKRYQVKDVDDLYNEALMHIHGRIKTFDPDRGRFSTWVAWQLKHIIPRYRLKEEIIYVPILPRFPRPMYEGLVDVTAKKEEEIEPWLTPELIAWVHTIVETMPEKWQRVYGLRSQGLTLEGVAKKLGITRERVRQIQKSIGKEICREYAKKNS